LKNTDDQDSDAADDTENNEDEPSNLVFDDYQLFEALNLLKGLAILAKRDS